MSTTMRVNGYTVHVDDREKHETERDIVFHAGEIGGRGDNRYVSAFVYVFDPVAKDGETLPSVIIRPSDQMFTTESARKSAACLLAAARWIEKNIGEINVR